jgi:hypothetical protein
MDKRYSMDTLKAAALFFKHALSKCRSHTRKPIGAVRPGLAAPMCCCLCEFHEPPGDSEAFTDSHSRLTVVGGSEFEFQPEDRRIIMDEEICNAGAVRRGGGRQVS